LHDLFVTIEAMSPGEFKNGGSGIEIRHGVHPSPLGTVFVAGTVRGICRLEFVEGEAGVQAAVGRLKRDWPAAEFLEDDSLATDVVEPLFARTSAVPMPAFHLLVRGTNLQVQVWRALLRIPAGAHVSYQQLARAIGYPQAVRAVASAVGANPVGFLIPCHRVLRNNGALGGYRWGEARKLAARVWESRGDAG
jgi:AraC family transcriptional regulator of adaptative response/methylated-DNA-[protein]-cysteine methyltransferase